MSSISAQAAEPLPSFDRVIDLYNQTNDLGRVSYLYRRCAALHLNVSAVLMRQNENKMAKDYENIANHYMLMSESVDRELDQKRNIKTKKPMEAVSLSVSHLSEAYSERMKSNKMSSGEYISGDKLLESELAQCIVPEAFAKKLGR